MDWIVQELKRENEMKKETKKRRIIIGISIAVVLMFGFIAVWWFSPGYVPERLQAMVLDHESDYTFVAETYYADFQAYRKEDSLDMAYSDGEKGIVFCATDGRKLELTEAEAASMEVVYASYLLDERTWDRTYVYEGFVSFCNIKGRESIVYSRNGEKPQYINAPPPPERDEKIHVFKITDHWYYVQISGMLSNR